MKETAIYYYIFTSVLSRMPFSGWLRYYILVDLSSVCQEDLCYVLSD